MAAAAWYLYNLNRPSMSHRCVVQVAAAKYAGTGIGPFGMATVWGSSVMLAVYLTRDISGAHLNPAVIQLEPTTVLECPLACQVTAALALNKPETFSPADAPAYIAAQLAGATLAGAVNYGIFRRGIEALEKKEGIVRGSKLSPRWVHLISWCGREGCAAV